MACTSSVEPGPKFDRLLDSGDEPIRDTSLYDYFWGTGRDQGGENRFGEVLMAVRNRLREELASDASGAG